MDKVKCSGTLGDAFIIVCKLYNSDIKTISHYTIHKHLYPKILEIYSLLNINVEECKNRVGEFIVGNIKPKDKYTPNPKFNLPNVDRFNLPDSYSVIQVESGTNDLSKRKLTNSEINTIKGDVVVLGTDSLNLNFKNRGSLDLRNKTSLLESFSIIEGSNNFYGTQGLLSFFALSQAIPSYIYLKSEADIHAVRHRIDMIPEWKKIVTYK